MFKSGDHHSGQILSASAYHAENVETVVGPSVVVEGDFSSEGNILVKGVVSGNVKTAQLLTVEEGAKILANVKAQDAVIAGEVKGNVRVGDKLELTQSAKILGDVSCQVLVVAAGAQLHGKVAMKGLQISGPQTPDEKKKPVRSKAARFSLDEQSDSSEHSENEE